ncbi:MAG: hypothetical protein ABI808_11610 [Pseudonocardiales bacterium]
MPVDEQDAYPVADDEYNLRRPPGVTRAAQIVFVAGVGCLPLAVVIVATHGGPALGLWFGITAFAYLWLAAQLWRGNNNARIAIMVLFAANVALDFLASMGIALFVTLALNALVIAQLTSSAAEQFFRPATGDPARP